MKKLYFVTFLFFGLLFNFTAFAQIDAVNDGPITIPTGSTLPNVTSNDTLNGVLVTSSNTNVTPVTTGPLSINSEGVFTIAPNVPTGNYTITYQLCQANPVTGLNLVPANCDTATATVNVFNIPDAVNDAPITIQPSPTPTTLLNVTTNDTLNGLPVTTANTNVTPMTTGPLSIDPNGVLTISPNALPGTYTIMYQLCEANPATGFTVVPANCDTATATVIVTASLIDAVADTMPTTNGTIGNPNVGNVLLDNPTGAPFTPDTLNGTPVMISQINLTVVIPASPLMPGAPVPSVNPLTGNVVVPSGTPSGTYTITYQICDILNPNSCDAATATIIVTSFLNLTTSSTYVDLNGDGFTNLGDVINYTFSVSNTGTLPITNINLSGAGLNFSGGTLASLNAGAINTTAFSATHVLTQMNINSGLFNVQITASGVYNSNPITNGINDTENLSISNAIKMNAFIDTNTNGFQDGAEQNFNLGTFNYAINGGATTSLTSSTGVHFLYETNATNSYNLSYVIPTAFTGQYTVAVASYPNVTVASGSGITTYNFAITRLPFQDLEVQTYQSGAPPRPGFTYKNTILIKNNGNLTIPSGTVTFIKDNLVSITAISQTGTTGTSTGFTYNFTNLLPLESRLITVTMQVPTIPTIALGQIVTNASNVTIPTGDINTLNNVSSISQVIVGSYDPNDKQETHGGKIVRSTFTSNDFLTYTIQFENTGTANATNVKVTDVLDAMLEPTSIKMITASSNYVLERVGNNLTWKFNGIDLPPSIANSTVGKGFIVFQIKPKPMVVVGTIIPNFANIFFDFNPAIVTNSCTTEFVATLSNQDFTFKSFSYSPNPVKNSVLISNNSTIDAVEISTLLGQVVLTKSINSLQSEIDLTNFSKGIYLMKVSSSGNEKVIKILKE